MNIATQISGRTYPGSASMQALKNMFTQLGIHVTHLVQDESLFYNAIVSKAWQQYNAELFFYESIADSAFHVLYSAEKIDTDTSRQILYAMLKSRPILTTNKITFTSDVSPFTRRLITKHMGKFYEIDLDELELTELSHLFSQLKPADYHLTDSEMILIKASIKEHFRKLLDQVKS